MATAPKLWCVKLVQPVKGNPKVIQALAQGLGLSELYKPTIIPNTPSFNERLLQIGSLVHIQPLVIAPNPYPYADHPMLSPNGVFYPSADKLKDIHQKCGNTSKYIDFPSETKKVVKQEILSKYRDLFSEKSTAS